MNDQTKHGIDEVIGINKSRTYERNTTQLIAKWINECPVNFVKTETLSQEVVLTLTRERKK
tara:strand:- start:33 stop:215 length:183 start_codon:yes stop_codon:yes gene_type:complete